MPEIALIDRAVIKVSGRDAERLLQDTLTAKIAPDLEGAGRWFALLSPQGKILAEGLVSRAEGAFWFDLPKAAREEFLKRMRLYKLRAEVELEDKTGQKLVGWSRMSPGEGVTYPDPREASLGYRVIAPEAEARQWDGDATRFEAARVKAGIAELGADFDADQQFPHDIGMDLLGGVDFDKGCFVGQEVVSRMQHRGAARRRPVVVKGNAPLTKGADLRCGGRVVGAVTSVAGKAGLAIARIDRVSDPLDCLAGDVPASLELPAWASYGFSAASGNGDSA